MPRAAALSRGHDSASDLLKWERNAPAIALPRTTQKAMSAPEILAG